MAADGTRAPGFRHRLPSFTGTMRHLISRRELTLLSYGDTVKNQAFRLGSAVGVQFHPEVTLPIITRWVHDLGTQEKQKILGESDRRLPGNARCCDRLVDAFAGGWSA